jgi:hypothetical protein
MLDRKFAAKGEDFQRQLAIFKFMMDLLMKYDIDVNIAESLADPYIRSKKSNYLGPNIPPFEVFLCCSNIRHKTCYKAFNSLDNYLKTCVKKNCTIKDNNLHKETAREMKNRIEPLDLTKLHESFYKLEISND